MIISASYRTDIPAYYGAWFLNRLRAGWAGVANPYGGQTRRVNLAADAVDGFVFWTRNPAPFEDGFAAVAAMDRPFVVQMTITGYPRRLEPGVLEMRAAVAAFRDLAERYGASRMVWRYDPVLLTEATPLDWHRENLKRLADALAGAADECVFSFAHIYRKSLRNLRTTGLAWRDPEIEEKRDVLATLAEIVRPAGFRATLCAQPELVSPALGPARCIDGARLERVAGQAIAAKTKGNRPGCYCAESRDIGRYDACPQGCVYCYANRSRSAAQRRLADHRPSDEQL